MAVTGNIEKELSRLEFFDDLLTILAFDMCVAKHLSKISVFHAGSSDGDILLGLARPCDCGQASTVLQNWILRPAGQGRQ